jgi:hypothetical protein
MLRSKRSSIGEILPACHIAKHEIATCTDCEPKHGRSVQHEFATSCNRHHPWLSHAVQPLPRHMYLASEQSLLAASVVPNAVTTPTVVKSVLEAFSHDSMASKTWN